MAAKEYSIYNKTRDSSVGDGVPVIHSAMEPLTALRVMIEGLGSDNEAGLWLTHITSFPMVPRLSPFDLVYLDKNFCVVDRFELLPAAEMPRFKSPAASALILPFQTISSLRIGAGDEFVICEMVEADSDAEQAVGTADVPAAIEETVKPLLAVEKVVQPSDGMESGPKSVAILAKTSQAAAQLNLTITEVEEPLLDARPKEEVAATLELTDAEAERPAIAMHEPTGAAFARGGKRKRRGKRQAFQPLGPVVQAKRTPPCLVEAESGASTVNPVVAPETPVASELVQTSALSSFDSPFLPLTLAPVAAEPAVTQSLELPAASAPSDLHFALALPAPPLGDAGREVPQASVELEDSIATVADEDEISWNPVSFAPEVPIARAFDVARRDDSSHALVPFAKREPGPDPHRALMPPVQSAVAADKTEAASDEKKPVVHRILRWLYPALYDQDRRHSPRRPLDGLVAYDWSGDAPERHEIGNISSTGIYLLTDQRWQPGQMLSLTLQRTGPLERSAERRVDLEAGAVRWGNDGVGLTFLWPEGMDLRLWETPARTGMQEAEPDYIVREMRMARALAFLRRICPAVADQARNLIYAQLSNVRVANAVEIALKAEKLLIHEPNADRMLAHPDLIIRILEGGSWVDVNWIQELWAGLLATSCTEEGQDESNLVFINLLSLLAPIHARILSAACAKAMSVMAGRDIPSPYLIACSPEEMARLTGSTNLMKVTRSIAELSDLGLLEKSTKASTNSISNITRTKPTHLGLQMYARCSGERGAA
jgi:hypothetical protein